MSAYHRSLKPSIHNKWTGYIEFHTIQVLCLHLSRFFHLEEKCILDNIIRMREKS